MYRELLEEVNIRLQKRQIVPQPPCSGQQIERLREQARTELGDEVPEAYLGFLRLTNGLDWNGANFFATETTQTRGHRPGTIEGLVPANLGYRDVEDMRDFLVFGSSGMELYVYDKKNRDYRIQDSVSMDTYETYADFDSLVTEVLRSRL
jgi:hypothetical protein